MYTPILKESVMSYIKGCFKCGQDKEISEFYKHSRMADGHLNKCKECTKRDVRKDRQVSERARTYDRKRSQSPERKRKLNKLTKRMRAKFPEKYKARNKLYAAVRDGRLEKPEECSKCGEIPRQLEAHHEDYDKPLEVIWLCTRCHRVMDGQTIIGT